MKQYEANNRSSIRELLDRLNLCHDGVIRRISFRKGREYDEQGNICYLYELDEHNIHCNIEIELLLNSHIGASKKQVVFLIFTDVISFRFFQERTFDYSEIYEVNFKQTNNGTFEFSFIEHSQKRILSLLIDSPQLICKEI